MAIERYGGLRGPGRLFEVFWMSSKASARPENVGKTWRVVEQDGAGPDQVFCLSLVEIDIELVQALKSTPGEPRRALSACSKLGVTPP